VKAAVKNRSSPAVRVCIVYEHSLFAHGIKKLLERDKALRMVGLVERPLLSVRGLKRLNPDVVVVEDNGGMAILESLEGVMGVAVSLKGDAATIFTGFPIRVSRPEELVRAIRTIAGRGKPRSRRKVAT
jgi:DNA-binding NarL/FixJ family response regulator